MAFMDLAEKMENIIIIFIGRSDQMGEFSPVFHKQGDYFFLTEIPSRTRQKAKVKHHASVI